MKLSELHTLIIPTYDRLQLLRALLRHLMASDLNVSILDSGPSSIVQPSDCPQSSRARFRIRRFSSEAYLYCKLLDELQRTKTPYVSICPDDDIVFPITIAKCIEALEANPDAVAAQGVYLSFDFESEPPNRVVLGSGWEISSVNADLAGARLIQLFDLYNPNFYAVFRTDVLRDIYEFLDDSKVKDYHYSECFQAAATVLSGKVLRIPDVYCARRDGPPADVVTDDCNKLRCLDWLKKDYVSFCNYYPLFRELVVNWWRRCDGQLSHSEMGKWCDAANMLFLARAFKDFPFDDYLQIDKRSLQLTHVMSTEIQNIKASLLESFASRAPSRPHVPDTKRRRLGRMIAGVASWLQGDTLKEDTHAGCHVGEQFDLHQASAERTLLDNGIRLKDDFKLSALHPRVLEAGLVIRQYVNECLKLNSSCAKLPTLRAIG